MRICTGQLVEDRRIIRLAPDFARRPDLPANALSVLSEEGLIESPLLQIRWIGVEHGMPWLEDAGGTLPVSLTNRFRLLGVDWSNPICLDTAAGNSIWEITTEDPLNGMFFNSSIEQLAQSFRAFNETLSEEIPRGAAERVMSQLRTELTAIDRSAMGNPLFAWPQILECLDL